MNPPAPSTVAVFWDVQTVQTAVLSFPVARLRIPLLLSLAGSPPSRTSEAAWLDAGAPLSVIPFYVHNQRLLWRPVGVRTTWAGQICDLGQIDFWFWDPQISSALGPYVLLAKFAQSDPPGTPAPVLLGLEFFLIYRASLNLPPPPQDGVIQVP
jgi:hypothetical protein